MSPLELKVLYSFKKLFCFTIQVVFKTSGTEMFSFIKYFNSVSDFGKYEDEGAELFQGL